MDDYGKAELFAKAESPKLYGLSSYDHGQEYGMNMVEPRPI